MEKRRSPGQALAGLGISFLATGVACAPATAQSLSAPKKQHAIKDGDSIGAPATGKWPDASNTGVPAGVKLTPSGSLSVTRPGTVISGRDIRGTVFVKVPNVTLADSRITAASVSVVRIALGVKGAVVRNCEINGVGDGNDGSSGINGQGTFIGNNIYNVENGVNVTGPSVIRDNYIHNLLASGSPHYDGIQIDGGHDVTISHNTIINSHGQTSAIMIDNYFRPVSHISVDNNLLMGGGYTVYSDGRFKGGPIAGVSFTNNRMGKGRWGYRAIMNNSPVWRGNVDYKTGADLGSR